jgi:hypothetical protein
MTLFKPDFMRIKIFTGEIRFVNFLPQGEEIGKTAKGATASEQSQDPGDIES